MSVDYSRLRVTQSPSGRRCQKTLPAFRRVLQAMEEERAYFVYDMDPKELRAYLHVLKVCKNILRTHKKNMKESEML